MASVVQVQIYQYLAKHQGVPPTVREISVAVGRSVSTTQKTLEKLKEKGFVTWESSKCRTVRLVYHA
jgi:predicted transcriptional regulator